MPTDLIVLLVAIVFNFILSSFVFLRSPKNAINRTFAAFGVTVILWTVFNYFADNALTHNLLYTRITLLFGILIAVSLVTLSVIFPRKLTIRKSFICLFLGFSVLNALLTLSPFFVTAVTKQPVGVQLTVGRLYPLFTSYFLISLLVVMRNYLAQYRGGSQVEKNQVRLFAAGVAIYAVFAMLSNLILPIVVSDWSSSRFGPLFTVPFIGITAYAMIKHRLFDVRLIVARSLAYILALATTASVFVLLTFGIFARILGTGDLSAAQQAFYIIIAILLALSFQSLKLFFDKATNTLFYRDAYEPQALLDELNKVLVGTIELNSLLMSSAEIISRTLKAEYCVFLIDKVENTPLRLVGDGLKTITKEDMRILSELVPRNVKITLTDDLDEAHQKTKAMLSRHDVAMMVSLTSSVKGGRKGIGCLALGVKKSGNPYSSQDIKILEIIADEMVIAIQNALRFEEIQQFAETLQGKVDEATRKLRRTNEKLKALDETKDEFISMASHQLRTPLTSVKGYVSMVLDGDAGKVSKQQQKLLDQAFISSQRMVYLIADLLNVSRLRTGKFVIEAKPTNLADVIEGEVTQLVETAKGRELTLSYHKPKDFPALNLDETKTRQVIMNFIDNAIYYTPAGGHIVINLEDKGSAIEYTVVDDGIGVPKAEQHHLFSKFYRAGNAKKARPDGTGLGLFMAKKVIVAQGGSVIFRSDEGKGSTFGFSFPKAKLQAAATAKATEKPTKQQ